MIIPITSWRFTAILLCTISFLLFIAMFTVNPVFMIPAIIFGLIGFLWFNEDYGWIKFASN